MATLRAVNGLRMVIDVSSRGPVVLILEWYQPLYTGDWRLMMFKFTIRNGKWEWYCFTGQVFSFSCCCGGSIILLYMCFSVLSTVAGVFRTALHTNSCLLSLTWSVFNMRLFAVSAKLRLIVIISLPRHDYRYAGRLIIAMFVMLKPLVSTSQRQRVFHLETT